MIIEEYGSVRADIVGGTLDLYPINLLLENTFTLNMALSLKAYCRLESNDSNKIEIYSKSYDSKLEISLVDFSIKKLFKNAQFSEEAYGKLSFVALILAQFNHSCGLKMIIDSDAPAGSGLGGSSSLGVTIYSALCKFYKIKKSREEIIEHVRNLEALILNQGIPGYQDYYPALFGGVLALYPKSNEIFVEQLFSKELKIFLEENLSLVYSNKSRLSGINNWKVYKDFFDGDAKIKNAFIEIAGISQKVYQAFKNSQFAEVLELMKQEGEIRNQVFDGFMSDDIKVMRDELIKLNKSSGIKICGAGGGGCFLVIHKNKSEVKSLCDKLKMRLLDFNIQEGL